MLNMNNMIFPYIKPIKAISRTEISSQFSKADYQQNKKDENIQNSLFADMLKKEIQILTNDYK